MSEVIRKTDTAGAPLVSTGVELQLKQQGEYVIAVLVERDDPECVELLRIPTRILDKSGGREGAIAKEFVALAQKAGKIVIEAVVGRGVLMVADKSV